MRSFVAITVALVAAVLLAVLPRANAPQGPDVARRSASSPRRVDGPARAYAEPAPRAADLRRDGSGPRQRLERLLQRGTARDRYQAFTLLADCAHAQDFDRYLRSMPAGNASAQLRERYGDGAARVASACGDLSARQVESRIELAASAADDGVPGAVTAWIEEGPFGDRSALTQRPDDPLIVQWAAQAIERVLAAARRSDTAAIGQFGMLCLNWELDDVARVRLLVESALQQRREDQIRSVLN
jgi:hypothetical protein